MNEKNDIVKVDIEIPAKLLEMINEIAHSANESLRTDLTGKDLINKWVIQYFGTKKSLDIMDYTINRYIDNFKAERATIDGFIRKFNETALEFDSISGKVNKEFHSFISKLEVLQQKV